MMDLPTVVVVAPELPRRSSSASTGASYYIQQRTALFARVCAICSGAGMVVQTLSDVGGGHPERIGSPVYGCYLAAILAMFSLWLLARGKPRTLDVVRGAELAAISISIAAVTVAIRLPVPSIVQDVAGFAAVHGLLSGEHARLGKLLFELCGAIIALLAATQILTVRAAVVPSSTRHSLALVTLVGLPVIMSCGMGWPVMLSRGPELTEHERGFLTVFSLSWWLFTSTACAVIAKVVHRLQSEVQVARRLGQYELEGKLGEGGMGVVYRARHALMKRPVAVKLLPSEQAGQDAIARFEREVQLTSELRHPNTVVIHDFGHTPEGTFYYAMELIECPSLEEIVKASGPMPSERVIHILRMVGGSLSEAHERGLVHRDIKPANILLGPHGSEPDMAKVLDFGLVRSIHAEAELTSAGMVMGTPHYLSPEAIRNSGRVDARSDIYALGAVAHYLLSGRHVFEGESGIEICAKHLREPPPPLVGSVLDLDVELGRLVLDCLAKEPEGRPASVRDMLDRLQRCPSQANWTRARAQAWWAERSSLLPRHDSPKATASVPAASATEHLRRA